MEKNLTAHDQTESEKLCDILTEDEKKSVLDHFAGMEKKSSALRMVDAGENERTIEVRLSGINWHSRLDTEKILKEANQRKHWKRDEISIKELKAQIKHESLTRLKKECDANYFYKLIVSHFKNLKGFFNTEINKEFIKIVCYFFSNDIRFESELNLCFNKGLMISGDAGLGKTETIKAIANNPLFPVKIYSMIEISEAVKEHGNFEINTNQMILLDDVGTEQAEVNHYGTKINWFKNFIETYYLNTQTFTGLIITSNCGADEIQNRYGYRVRSRMREMFNMIQLTGKDLRK